MAEKGRNVEVDIGGRHLALSNLDKVLYPDTGFTKAEVIDYYARVAPTMLTHLAGRHLTLKRYPNGVDGKFFFEKACPGHRPPWVNTAKVVGSDGVKEHCVVDEVAALVWAANLAALELHTPMSCAADVDTPTMVVFDLDPGEPAGVLDCAQVGLWVRDTLDQLGLQCLVKTSGSKGLQVYLPLNSPTTHDDAAAFSKALAQLLEKHHPDRVVSVQRKELRRGKVLVDWSQNSRHKTTVCAYSLRARPHPTASTPLRWVEVEEALAQDEATRLVFEAGEVLARIEEHGDLFADVTEIVQTLPTAAHL